MANFGVQGELGFLFRCSHIENVSISGFQSAKEDLQAKQVDHIGDKQD